MAHRQEPPRPPTPEPTIAVYENISNTTPEDNRRHDLNLSSWSTISIRLVGSHPLWGHYLYVTDFQTWDATIRIQRTNNIRWNAARALASFLQRNSDLYLGCTVLELGAGGGLPGLVTAKCGAQKVPALACLAWLGVRERAFLLATTANCILY